MKTKNEHEKLIQEYRELHEKAVSFRLSLNEQLNFLRILRNGGGEKMSRLERQEKIKSVEDGIKVWRKMSIEVFREFEQKRIELIENGITLFDI